MTRPITREEFIKRTKDKQRDRRRSADLDHRRYRMMIEEQKRKGLWGRRK